VRVYLVFVYINLSNRGGIYPDVDVDVDVAVFETDVHLEGLRSSTL